MSKSEMMVQILSIVISVCVALITRYVVPYVKSLLRDSEFAEILDVVDTAVHAVEEATTNPKQGKFKKAEVMKFATAWLNEKGIKITEEQLDKLIDAAVFAMNNKNEE